jgi:uncharacterized SAM-binding protein YcdF (DUF218 family)
VLFGGCGYLLPAAARFLDVSEPPRAVDCVMVLGGGSETRPFVAAALVKAGLAKRVLLATARNAPEVQDGVFPPEHEIARRVLVGRGVPAEAVVVLPGECDSTIDEAHALGRFLDREPGVSVAVVTSGYHTRRARGLFRKVLGRRMAGVMFVAAPTDGFDETNWWRYRAGVRTYLNEYVKLAFYAPRF